MIDYIIGKVVELQNNSVVLENNGIGYKLLISEETNRHLKMENKATLCVAAYRKADGSESHYGFFLETERVLFERLMRINGIGGHYAISALISSHTDVIKAIENKNFEFFKKTGLGKVTLTLIFEKFK